MTAQSADMPGLCHCADELLVTFASNDIDTWIHFKANLPGQTNSISFDR